MAALPNKAQGKPLKTALIQTRCSLTNPPICYPISIEVDKKVFGRGYDTRGQDYMEARKKQTLTESPDVTKLTLGTVILDELVKKAPIVTAGELSLKPPSDLNIDVAAEKTAAAAATAAAEAAAKARPTLKLKDDTDENKRIVIDETRFINNISKDLFTVTPNDTTITWTSSNNKAVTVDNTGKIGIVNASLIGVPETPVTIKASVGDGEDQQIVFTLEMKPTLKRRGDEGVLTQTIKGIKRMLNLSQFIQVPDGVVPKWESSNDTIATVNDEGNVISHTIDQATITAYVGENASKSDSDQKVVFTVTVKEEEEQFGGRRRSKGTVRQKLGKLRRRMGTRAKKQ